MTVKDITPQNSFTLYKTAVFKIYNPSRWKRAALHDALRRNHLSYAKLLRILSAKVESYAMLSRKQRRIAIEKEATALAKPLPLPGSAKAGIVNDVLGQIESYLMLLETNPTALLPTARRLFKDPKHYVNSLAQLTSALSLEEENVARYKLLLEDKSGEFRPLLFLRNRPTDGYLLLKDPLTGNYAIYLNLHPRNSRFARQVHINELMDVRTGEIISFSTTTGCIFPLAFAAEYQANQFLDKAKPQTAKLIKRHNEYEVHINFEFHVPKRETKTFMGIGRGFTHLTSLCGYTE